MDLKGYAIYSIIIYNNVLIVIRIHIPLCVKERIQKIYHGKVLLKKVKFQILNAHELSREKQSSVELSTALLSKFFNLITLIAAD